MRCPLSPLAIVTCILMTGTVFAQQDDPPPAPPIVDAMSLAVDAKITAVTLYPGRAAVTRTASVDLQPGVYDLRFADLPLAAQNDSLQARTGTGGDGALKVLSVDFLQEAVADPAATPQVVELDKEIRSFEQAIRAMIDQRSLIKSQEAFLDALTIRTSSDASNASGTGKLDLEEVKSQMQFITAERKRLNSERASLDIEQPKLEARLEAAKANRNAAAGAAGVTRSAVVSVVASSPFQGEVALTYLVSSATWQPAYNVRATAELNSVQIEYDAILTQRTGEDWNEVRLTLSTAQPTVAANPPTIQPWYVDIARPELQLDAALEQRPAAPMERDRRASGGEDKSKEFPWQNLADDAQVGGGGPSVTFELPRAVTVKTSSDRQQRTRIAAIDSKARFVHVATPLLTEAVYLRGDLTNSSAYQLLAGPASIFVGQDYVGPTAIASVAPQGEFQMHFGIDQTVKARKQLLAKTTESTGLLSGGRRTSSNYRITIDNSSGRDLTLELWDRIPVSRSEDIQIQMIDLTTKLATDAHYAAEQQPQGLLKWWLMIPANARGLQSFTIDYAVRIDRAKDVSMTPLPE